MTEYNENNDLNEINRIFEKYPAPQPSPALVDDIKRKITSRPKRTSIPVLIFKTAITTAAVILISIFITNEIREIQPSQQAKAVSKIFSEQTDDIAVYEKEIELLSSELIALRLDEENSASNPAADSLTNVEADFYEIDNTFWKG